MTTIPKLLLVTARLGSRRPLLEVVRLAVKGGLDAVQIREKDLAFDELLALSRAVRAAAAPASVAINGSIEIARALRIGVHLPESGPSVKEARDLLGPDALIGKSIHSPAEAKRVEGASYLVAGHVFASTSKPDLAPLGIDGLSAIVSATSIPVLAIGGIDRSNAALAMRTGAKGVAVMSAINQSDDPETAAAEITDVIDEQFSETHVTVNGVPTVIAPNQTIQHFLIERGLKDRLVVVEINGKIASRKSYSVRVLEPEDSVEIVHFVGGG